MKIQDLKSKCLEASEFYYKYLEDNNKGIEEINIYEKKLVNGENNTWEIYIGRKLFNPDCIKIHNQRYDEDYDLANFIIKEYDADNKLLIIKFITETNFGNTPTNNLKIIYDLKFLIKNVINWYTNNGQKIHFDKKTKIEVNADNYDLYPPDMKADQIQAFRNILSGKYNYIWGPPGTGKTRYVLSSTILYYLNNDNPKIGIFAPTNSALEEILSSVINHFDKLRIPREDLIRIGTPSRSYAEKYPETCEIQGLEKQLKEIEKQIDNVKNVIEYRRGKYAFNSLFTIQKDIQKITDLNTQLGTLLDGKSRKDKELEAIIRESKSFKSHLKCLLNIDSTDYQNIINYKREELLKIQNQIDLLNAETTQCFLFIKNVDTQSKKIKDKIQNINTRNYLAVAEQLNQTSREIEEYLNEKASLSQAYSDCDDTELSDLKKQYEENYNNLMSMKVEERIKKCSIIGMTLDCYIGRFLNSKINFSNIFLDEAGYVSLIKALPLFSNRCSITFLGDHKQLPPVCELRDPELGDYNSTAGLYYLLWSKPSIFAEIILNHDEEDCLKILMETDCPTFKYTQKSILIETHRFGSNLAELLDKFIYNIGYKSALDSDHNVELCYVDAENPIRDGRKNKNECNKIFNILNGYVDGDYCILTPYKDQVSVLQRKLQRSRQEERILTIHKSQGREWDTVILSIVDGHNITPWFTDTSNVKFQTTHVLNTAISRARKKLIIVCDAKYWLSKQDAKKQLISNLINISKKIE